MYTARAGSCSVASVVLVYTARAGSCSVVSVVWCILLALAVGKKNARCIVSADDETDRLRSEHVQAAGERGMREEQAPSSVLRVCVCVSVC